MEAGCEEAARIVEAARIAAQKVSAWSAEVHRVQYENQQLRQGYQELASLFETIKQDVSALRDIFGAALASPNGSGELHTLFPRLTAWVAQLNSWAPTCGWAQPAEPHRQSTTASELPGAQQYEPGPRPGAAYGPAAGTHPRQPTAAAPPTPESAVELQPCISGAEPQCGQPMRQPRSLVVAHDVQHGSFAFPQYGVDGPNPGSGVPQPSPVLNSWPYVAPQATVSSTNTNLGTTARQQGPKEGAQGPNTSAQGVTLAPNMASRAPAASPPILPSVHPTYLNSGEPAGPPPAANQRISPPPASDNSPAQRALPSVLSTAEPSPAPPDGQQPQPQGLQTSTWHAVSRATTDRKEDAAAGTLRLDLAPPASEASPGRRAEAQPQERPVPPPLQFGSPIEPAAAPSQPRAREALDDHAEASPTRSTAGDVSQPDFTAMLAQAADHKEAAVQGSQAGATVVSSQPRRGRSRGRAIGAKMRPQGGNREEPDAAGTSRRGGSHVEHGAAGLEQPGGRVGGRELQATANNGGGRHLGGEQGTTRVDGELGEAGHEGEEAAGVDAAATQATDVAQQAPGQADYAQHSAPPSPHRSDRDATQRSTPPHASTSTASTRLEALVASSPPRASPDAHVSPTRPQSSPRQGAGEVATPPEGLEASGQQQDSPRGSPRGAGLSPRGPEETPSIQLLPCSARPSPSQLTQRQQGNVVGDDEVIVVEGHQQEGRDTALARVGGDVPKADVHDGVGGQHEEGRDTALARVGGDVPKADEHEALTEARAADPWLWSDYEAEAMSSGSRTSSAQEVRDAWEAAGLVEPGLARKPRSHREGACDPGGDDDVLPERTDGGNVVGRSGGDAHMGSAEAMESGRSHGDDAGQTAPRGVEQCDDHAGGDEVIASGRAQDDDVGIALPRTEEQSDPCAPAALFPHLSSFSATPPSQPGTDGGKAPPSEPHLGQSQPHTGSEDVGVESGGKQHVLAGSLGSAAEGEPSAQPPEGAANTHGGLPHVVRQLGGSPTDRGQGAGTRDGPDTSQRGEKQKGDSGGKGTPGREGQLEVSRWVADGAGGAAHVPSPRQGSGNAEQEMKLVGIGLSAGKQGSNVEAAGKPKGEAARDPPRESLRQPQVNVDRGRGKQPADQRPPEEVPRANEQRRESQSAWAHPSSSQHVSNGGNPKPGRASRGKRKPEVWRDFRSAQHSGVSATTAGQQCKSGRGKGTARARRRDTARRSPSPQPTDQGATGGEPRGGKRKLPRGMLDGKGGNGQASQSPVGGEQTGRQSAPATPRGAGRQDEAKSWGLPHHSSPEVGGPSGSRRNPKRGRGDSPDVARVGVLPLSPSNPRTRRGGARQSGMRGKSSPPEPRAKAPRVEGRADARWVSLKGKADVSIADVEAKPQKVHAEAGGPGSKGKKQTRLTDHFGAPVDAAAGVAGPRLEPGGVPQSAQHAAPTEGGGGSGGVQRWGSTSPVRGGAAVPGPLGAPRQSVEGNQENLRPAQGRIFKYQETVRGKEAREGLKGVACRQCKEFYAALAAGQQVARTCAHGDPARLPVGGKAGRAGQGAGPGARSERGKSSESTRQRAVHTADEFTFVV